MPTPTRTRFILALTFTAIALGSAAAPAEAGMLRKLLEKRQEQKTDAATSGQDGLYVEGANYQGKKTNESYGGRDLVVYTPSKLPASGGRALVVVLHGGMGNAVQIQEYLGLDPLADQYGFVVAYLNGTKVMRIGSENMRGWNAGDCCGQPQANNVDDVAYITGAVKYLTAKYGIDPNHVYGMGHSNGGMMTQRLMCQTNLYAAAIPVSAPLETDDTSCPPARGKHILALHGADDANVPIEGGHGTNAVNRKTNYHAARDSQAIYQKSGADYQLEILPGADHNPKTINASLLKTDGVTLPQKIVQFFGLDKR